MSTLSYSLLATLIVSLISFVGVLALFFKKNLLNRLLLLLVGFSAGALLGGAFIHIIPELMSGHGHTTAQGEIFSENIEHLFLVVVIGFAVFFLLEKILHWHHHHKQCEECENHTFPIMNLVGDGLHNFIDGMIIVASFAISFELGVATTVAVIVHELPQELSDFGVLVYGGFSRLKALFFNFLTALTAILGALFGYVLINYIENIQSFLLALAAGGFIYIAASDLIPELNKEKRLYKSLTSFIFFLLGIGFMWGVKFLFE
ncbi:ZIP family metal transporter [Candidatus Falkowbacteria bacterium]|jgi:zinc and cadmium transporter|nr:ZIP family metal transporter [Candidatus Falkowbacteria bacterium]MBT7007012.1 ZIP family metal transporter [Candidatus Falkowbacteria bacterium]